MKLLFQNWRKYLLMEKRKFNIDNRDRPYRSDAEAEINPSDMHLEKDSSNQELKDKILTTFKKEGGAAGFEPLYKAAKEIDKDITEEEVKEILSALSNIEKHEDSDFIDVSGLKEAVEVFLEAKEELLNEKKRKKKKSKKDACYHKVKARYDVWPSAYASGALVKCRKAGAKNWGTGGKKKKRKNESLSLEDIIREEVEAALEECWSTHERVPGTKKGSKGSCRLKTNESEELKEKKRKLTAKPSSETSLRDWFGRKGAKGKKGGWVDCNTCRKDKKTGRKKCSACGRSGGEKRAKYPSCRPTPGACGKKGSYGKKSKAGKKG
jgi:hypothetical protein